MVEPAPGMAPSLPFWQTEAARPVACAFDRSCRAARRDCRAARPRRRLGGDAMARRRMRARRERGGAGGRLRAARDGALGAIPDSSTIVVERFFDGLGGTQMVIHAPFGIRFNRALGLAMRKRLCQSFDFEIQASAIDDGVLLALNARHSFPLEETLAMLPRARARATCSSRRCWPRRCSRCASATSRRAR